MTLTRRQAARCRASLLDDEGLDVAEELRRQSVRLRESAGHLLRMADEIDRTRRAREMGIELDPQEMREVFGDTGEGDPTQYAQEAERRWGDTDAYRESSERARRYTKQDWLQVKAEGEDLEARLAAAFTSGAAADSDDAAALAEEHRRAIDRRFWTCSHAMHRALGQMYVDDERFTAHYDRRAPGLAAWLCHAIVANAERNGS